MISAAAARPARRRLAASIVTVALAAVGLACGGDDGSTPEDTDEVVAVTGDDECAVVGATELASLLDMEAPEVLQGGDDLCLFSFGEGDDDTTLGSILKADAAHGQGLLDSLAGYDDEAIEAFGVRRITGIDGVEGTFGPVGFVAVIRDEVTYQFVLDGPEADRSTEVLRLVRALAARG